jgi:hypothetical protein
MGRQGLNRRRKLFRQRDSSINRGAQMPEATNSRDRLLLRDGRSRATAALMQALACR